MTRTFQPNGYVVVAALLLVPPLTAGCGRGGAETGVKAGSAPKPIPVKVVPVRRQAVERSVEVVGSLKGWEEVSLGAKKGGRVVKVLHDMGDHVKPGEPLVELEAVDATLAVAQARSKYLADLARLGITEQQAEAALLRHGISEKLLTGEDARRLIEESPAIVQATVAVEKASNNLNRQRNLHQRGAGTLEELQNIENDYKAAVAAKQNAVSTARNVIATSYGSKVAHESAQQVLKDMTVRAPDPSRVPEGTDRSSMTYGITKRSVSEGQILKDGDSVMELVVESPLRLWTNVPENHSAEVKVGQTVKISVASYPEKEFKGVVARINPTVNPVSRTFQVESVVPNEAGTLRPGGFAKASILIDTKAEATVVPIESVLKFAGVTKVFVVEGGKARSINVETGLEGSGWVEITTPLPPEAAVVTDGWTLLADGTPVTVTSETGKGKAGGVPPAPGLPPVKVIAEK